ncbi:uncharacterized protein LOC111718169 isoform X2 [Eurytemora carolleeae]|uniref:uncharacterized protein LOC111718169 isoform X2 n=1 Tax=Eurytemora carolleeae TaxID=1294199 RepID=UPI000C7751CA|nr:uncharacterized protein LOC111718169 isoform X2 [Eurytemora carolleeae]|eukprot:XP_023349458.1 uncharacterized protein LOC111718169 isoform X2 [Eurytemora affinis]
MSLIQRAIAQKICRFACKSINNLKFFHASPCSWNSGKFKKIKGHPDSYFQRKSVVEPETNPNFLFSREYLDRSMEKIHSSESRGFYSFLNNRRCSLTEEEVGLRENVTRDWNHISDTIQDLGIPEFADVVGGLMFAGGHLRQTTTCCLTLRLADHISLLNDEELKLCIRDTSGWPSDVSNSEVCEAVFKQIDQVCSSRCSTWNLTDLLEYSLLSSTGHYISKEKLFQKSSLTHATLQLNNLSLRGTMLYLLLCSYEYNIASELSISEEDGKKMENTLIKGFNKLIEVECALVYSALKTGLRYEPAQLKSKIESTYGFRL